MDQPADLAVFRAIADPNRRALVDLLANGERAVWELLAHFDISQPALSKHLRILREAGLVTLTRVGREHRYRLEAARLRVVYDWVGHYQRFWEQRLDRLGDYLDDHDRRRGSGPERNTKPR